MVVLKSIVSQGQENGQRKPWLHINLEDEMHGLQPKKGGKILG